MQEPGMKLRFSISLDDEVADIDVDSRRSIRDLIRHALAAFGAVEDADLCHLAGPDRLYFPQQGIGDAGLKDGYAGLKDGYALALRLPL